MPWDTILQFVIAVLLIIVTAVGHSISTHMKNIHMKLDSIESGNAELVKQQDGAAKSLVKALKYMRRQLHFERYQRGVDEIIMEQMEISAQARVKLLAPHEDDAGDDGL